MFSSSIATSSRSSLVPSSFALHGRFHALRWRAGRSFCTRMTEAHQAERIIFVFRTTNKSGMCLTELISSSIFSAASLAHRAQVPTVKQYLLRYRQTGSTRRASGTHGGGGGVLFMVSGRIRIRSIARSRIGLTSYGSTAWRTSYSGSYRRRRDRCAGNKWLTNGILVTHRGHGRHFYSRRNAAISR